VIAHVRADREEGDTARAIHLQQLGRTVERAGGEQIHLAVERDVGEQRPGGARGVLHGPAEHFQRIGEREIIRRQRCHGIGLAEHAALQPAQPPRQPGLAALFVLRVGDRRRTDGGPGHAGFGHPVRRRPFAVHRQ
jgi:hypothetical protein